MGLKADSINADTTLAEIVNSIAVRIGVLIDFELKLFGMYLMQFNREDQSPRKQRELSLLRRILRARHAFEAPLIDLIFPKPTLRRSSYEEGSAGIRADRRERLG